MRLITSVCNSTLETIVSLYVFMKVLLVDQVLHKWVDKCAHLILIEDEVIMIIWRHDTETFPRNWLFVSPTGILSITHSFFTKRASRAL